MAAAICTSASTISCRGVTSYTQTNSYLLQVDSLRSKCCIPKYQKRTYYNLPAWRSQPHSVLSSLGFGTDAIACTYIFVPPCRLGKACCEACPSRLVASGEVFLAGLRPDPPSRSDIFLLLRVAARLRRGGRVGSYVVR